MDIQHTTNGLVFQQLQVNNIPHKMQPMVALDPIKAYAKRLHQACDKWPQHIRKDRGRYKDLRIFLADRGCKVSPQAVGKWLNGETIPTHKNGLAIANALNEDFSALQFGSPPHQDLVPDIPDDVIPDGIPESLRAELREINYLLVRVSPEQRNLIGHILRTLLIPNPNRRHESERHAQSLPTPTEQREADTPPPRHLSKNLSVGAP